MVGTCGKEPLFTPRLLAPVGRSCEWLQQASSFHLSFLFCSLPAGLNTDFFFLFKKNSARDMPSCYTVSKLDLMFLKELLRWITTTQSGIILQLYFRDFILCSSVFHALIGICKQDHLHQMVLCTSVLTEENILKCETSETIILRYVRDGLDAWNIKKEQISQWCVFEIQVAVGVLTNRNTQAGNKTRENPFLL